MVCVKFHPQPRRNKVADGFYEHDGIVSIHIHELAQATIDIDLNRYPMQTATHSFVHWSYNYMNVDTQNLSRTLILPVSVA